MKTFKRLLAFVCCMAVILGTVVTMPNYDENYGIAPCEHFKENERG